MQAQPNKTYAQIINGKCHWVFTSNELPEWNESQVETIDITGLDAREGYDYANGVFTAPAPYMAPVKTPEQVQAEIVSAVQFRLDAFAKERGYDSILSACTYATSTVPRFTLDGQCAVDARDATWSALYALLGDVQQGTRPMASGYADVEILLPTLVWPA